jgi:hypothetical protein
MSLSFSFCLNALSELLKLIVVVSISLLFLIAQTKHTVIMMMMITRLTSSMIPCSINYKNGPVLFRIQQEAEIKNLRLSAVVQYILCLKFEEV